MVGQQYPLGGPLAGFAQEIEVRLIQPGKTKIFGQVSQHRLEIQITIGDVQSNNAIVAELFEIELDRFAGEQVNGDGIGIKGIHDDQLKLPVFRQLDLKASVAQYDKAFGRAVAHVSEIVPEISKVCPGDLLNRAVDIEEDKSLAGFTIARQGPGTQADGGDLFFRFGSAEFSEDLSDGPGAVVVSERLTIALRPDDESHHRGQENIAGYAGGHRGKISGHRFGFSVIPLDAVRGGAVGESELLRPSLWCTAHFEHAVKVARLVQEMFVAAHMMPKEVVHHESAHAQTEQEGPADEEIVEQR